MRGLPPEVSHPPGTVSLIRDTQPPMRRTSSSMLPMQMGCRQTRFPELTGRSWTNWLSGGSSPIRRGFHWLTVPAISGTFKHQPSMQGWNVAVRPPRATLVGLLLLVASNCVSGCGSTGPASAGRSPATEPSAVGGVSASRPITDQSVCAQIDQTFYFPRVPAGGYTVTRVAARHIELLLGQAPSAGLHGEATTLQRAITTDNEAEMVSVILHVENSTCTPSGITPAT